MLSAPKFWPPKSARAHVRQFASVFPIVFMGALLAGFAFQYVKNTIQREELDIALPELPENVIAPVGTQARTVACTPKTTMQTRQAP